MIRGGFALSDGRVTRPSDDGSTAAIEADVSARYAPLSARYAPLSARYGPLSARIRHGFEALEPPIYDDDERPTPALAVWFAIRERVTQAVECEALRVARALLDCEARIALEQLLRELRPFAWAP